MFVVTDQDIGHRNILSYIGSLLKIISSHPDNYGVSLTNFAQYF